MVHLMSRGLRVTGIELSECACRDFFVENGLSFRQRPDGERQRFIGDGIELLCGDFFGASGDDLPPVDAVYDRAALVALPQAMRPAYAEHLLRLAPPASRILLITLDYDQSEMSGPPFAVPSREVRDLFDGACMVEPLQREDCLGREPRFREKGLSRLHESAWLLTRQE
jgi:thiopurine S-methyltransferase